MSTMSLDIYDNAHLVNSSDFVSIKTHTLLYVMEIRPYFADVKRKRTNPNHAQGRKIILQDYSGSFIF